MLVIKPISLDYRINASSPYNYGYFASFRNKDIRMESYKYCDEWKFRKNTIQYTREDIEHNRGLTLYLIPEKGYEWS